MKKTIIKTIVFTVCILSLINASAQDGNRILGSGLQSSFSTCRRSANAGIADRSFAQEIIAPNDCEKLKNFYYSVNYFGTRGNVIHTNPPQLSWTAYSFNAFYRELKTACPAIACKRKLKDGTTQDVLAIWFSRLNNTEVNQLYMDSDYEIANSNIEYIITDFRNRFCLIDKNYLRENIGMVQQIIKYHDKIQTEW